MALVLMQAVPAGDEARSPETARSWTGTDCRVEAAASQTRGRGRCLVTESRLETRTAPLLRTVPQGR